jgi:hypothetical protein
VIGLYNQFAITKQNKTWPFIKADTRAIFLSLEDQNDTKT